MFGDKDTPTLWVKNTPTFRDKDTPTFRDKDTQGETSEPQAAAVTPQTDEFNLPISNRRKDVRENWCFIRVRYRTGLEAVIY